MSKTLASFIHARDNLESKKCDERAKSVIDTSGFRTHAHFCSRGQTTRSVRLKSTALDHSAIVSRVRMKSFSEK
jgi:hypothetical protein